MSLLGTLKKLFAREPVYQVTGVDANGRKFTASSEQGTKSEMQAELRLLTRFYKANPHVTRGVKLRVTRFR